MAAAAAASAVTTVLGSARTITTDDKHNGSFVRAQPCSTCNGQQYLQISSQSVASSSGRRRRAAAGSGQIKAAAATQSSAVDAVAEGNRRENWIQVLGKVSLEKKNVRSIDMVDVGALLLDNAYDLLGRKLLITLVSNEIDPKTKKGKRTEASGVINWSDGDGDLVADAFTYSVNFRVPKDFGEPGAILVSNQHLNEVYLKCLTIRFPDGKKVEFLCNSWVYPEDKYQGKDRIFFSNKTYLPRDTPEGLKDLKELEFKELRGDGTGTRQEWDRIYDYDVYNDLGVPSPRNPRALLNMGGSEHKYPRRCRTGRPKRMTEYGQLEDLTWSLLAWDYVPRDEAFGTAKTAEVYAGGLNALLHKTPTIFKKLFNDEFDSFEEIFDLYEKEVYPDNKYERKGMVFWDYLLNPWGDSRKKFKYPLPDIIQNDKWAWKQDEEFGRQFLAGFNPMVIKAVQEYPPKSTLDPKAFPSATALTDNHVLPFLEGQTVAQAIEKKKLFTVDHRDIFLPYINRFESTGTGVKTYAPRVIFYHNSKGHMQPVAIELSSPPKRAGGPCINRVFTPSAPGSSEPSHLWELAKLHVNAVDYTYLELISHWISAHAVMEPIIISTNRNISKLHPIYTLLSPLFTHTMVLNALGRQILVSRGGFFEIMFVTGAYSTEVTSVVYDALWRFDHAGIPDSLVARGMAEPADDSHPGGVKLVVEDYPFAKDGLELWDAIKGWVSAYVNRYYSSDEAVKADVEIQSWWDEVINVGHADKKDAPWWPKLDSIASMIQIITTISWVAGPHHAAVNFGQYSFGGFMPNRPTRTRRHIPEEGSKEYEELMANPEKFMLSMIPGSFSATVTMTSMEILSTHSVEEEYQGMRSTDQWTSDPVIKEAFDEFSAKIETLKTNITLRNQDPTLFNRAGPGNCPYTLLYPHSGPGITGQGVPYSICQ